MIQSPDASHHEAAAVSPRSMPGSEPPVQRSLRESLEAMDMRADPDAQATITDFTDFTDHLPSDMIRSLTLIGQLDETYAASSQAVHDATTTWASRSSAAAVDQAAANALRSDISENMTIALQSRLHSHAEALRMFENVNKHYDRASVLLAKLRNMLENYPSAEDLGSCSAAPTKAAPLSKKTQKPDKPRPKRPRAPKIIIPGEVLAPYELDDDSSVDDDDESSEDEKPSDPRKAPTPPLPSARHKPTGRPGRPPKSTTQPANNTNAAEHMAAGTAPPVGLATGPPEPGSAEAPWLRLTPVELARLRKKMKKNVTWSPSDTMIARELNHLCRGPEAYRAARQKALEQGRDFEDVVLPSAPDPSGAAPPAVEGALSAEALADVTLTSSNKGMKLNEAKKLKREAMAKMAAEEAEASERKLEEIAKMLLQPTTPSHEPSKPAKPAARSAVKRKRAAGDDESPEVSESVVESTASPAPMPAVDVSATFPKITSVVSAPALATARANVAASAGRLASKRIKVETPIPPPKLSIGAGDTRRHAAVVAAPPLPQSRTPVPPPARMAPAAPSATDAARPSTSISPQCSVPPAPGGSSAEPRTFRKSTTPILPPTQEISKRETRAEANKRLPAPAVPAASNEAPAPSAGASTPQTRPVAQSATPVPAPAPEQQAPSGAGRRPGSRGNSSSNSSSIQPEQAPGVGVLDRPRRSSTVRLAPAAAAAADAAGSAAAGTGQRTKRPANTTSSGDNSAVGKRKAATRKKARAPKRDKGASSSLSSLSSSSVIVAEPEVDEFDEDGTPIDPGEPRYCVCNRVSFGTMIACESEVS
ncbi:hypothetical protein BROUX41_002478 [Berkeleyomyces rouxiae]